MSRSAVEPLRRQGLALAIAMAAIVGSCDGSGSRPPPPVDARLAEGVVARVGSAEVAASTVARIARAQGITPAEARDRAVFDALFAEDARDLKLDAAHPMEVNAALGRALLRDLSREARAAGPVTDQEVQQFTDMFWFDVARPPSVMTVHAVVQVKAEDSPETWAKAEEVARAIRQAVEPATSLARASEMPNDPKSDQALAEFLTRAKAVDAAGLTVLPQPLPPIAADAQSVTREGRQPFDPAFTKAAMSLGRRGDLIGPVRSDFGVHVIMATGLDPGASTTFEERRALFERDIIDARVGALREAVLQRASADAPVIVDRAVDGLLQQVVTAQ